MDSRFEFVCRVCLVNNDSSSVMPLLSDQRTRDILFECTSVRVTPEDRGPQQLCAKCWNRCKNWSAFKELAKDSERQLGLMLKKKDEHVVAADADEVVKEEPLEYLEGYSVALVPEKEDNLAAIAVHETDKQQKEEEETPLVETEGPSEFKKKVHKCRYCAKNFRFLGSLKRHELFHVNGWAFQCDVCGGKFRTNESLERHKVVHIDAVRAFECDLCDKKYTTKQVLKIHKMRHANIRPFKCGQCDKTFCRRNELVSHSQTHSTKKRFKCAICFQRFGYKANWTRHMKSQH